MTRRQKNKDRGRSGDFSHTPFRALKGFAAAGKPPPAAVPSRQPSAPAEDDDALFRRAMDGTMPLHGADAPDRATARAAVPPAGPQEPQLDEQLFLEAMSTMGTATFGAVRGADEERNDTGVRSPSSRMRQLKRGTIRVGAELDLHGFVKDEALRRLEHFIASAAAQGLEAVLVITGKGTNSPEGPVLPNAVAAWLRGPGLRYAAEFHPAPRDRGGSGACVVFLRRR